MLWNHLYCLPSQPLLTHYALGIISIYSLPKKITNPFLYFSVSRNAYILFEGEITTYWHAVKNKTNYPDG